MDRPIEIASYGLTVADVGPHCCTERRIAIWKINRRKYGVNGKDNRES
ncbi:hypothetical protein Q2T41_19205 [Maribacter confluentis]|uniref:Uncharacterized protein n=1 Tax=Maribacter confluentis TaxID=1656093 RepID=A0ABT8RWC3_9FLAO|nr:hypothetical protein [Maribacter confluentis]MDO1514782.1 hypothetical protein [Maribacter confluentis]